MSNFIANFQSLLPTVLDQCIKTQDVQLALLIKLKLFKYTICYSISSIIYNFLNFDRFISIKNCIHGGQNR